MKRKHNLFSAAFLAAAFFLGFSGNAFAADAEGLDGEYRTDRVIVQMGLGTTAEDGRVVYVAVANESPNTVDLNFTDVSAVDAEGNPVEVKMPEIKKVEPLADEDPMAIYTEPYEGDVYTVTVMADIGGQPQKATFGENREPLLYFGFDGAIVNPDKATFDAIAEGSYQEAHAAGGDASAADTSGGGLQNGEEDVEKGLPGFLVPVVCGIAAIAVLGGGCFMIYRKKKREEQ